LTLSVLPISTAQPSHTRPKYVCINTDFIKEFGTKTPSTIWCVEIKHDTQARFPYSPPHKKEVLISSVINRDFSGFYHRLRNNDSRPPSPLYNNGQSRRFIVRQPCPSGSALSRLLIVRGSGLNICFCRKLRSDPSVFFQNGGFRYGQF
jgi:hypothetical protein